MERSELLRAVNPNSSGPILQGSSKATVLVEINCLESLQPELLWSPNAAGLFLLPAHSRAPMCSWSHTQAHCTTYGRVEALLAETERATIRFLWWVDGSILPVFFMSDYNFWPCLWPRLSVLIKPYSSVSDSSVSSDTAHGTYDCERGPIQNFEYYFYLKNFE